MMDVVVVPVDPLSVADDDFERHRTPAEWQGLSVTRILFRDGATEWAIWRVANNRRPEGPLWVVPHDNEDAAFSAALVSVRSWGGVAVMVDTGGGDGRATRRNYATTGEPIDPNRNFWDGLPVYSGRLLADLGADPRLIVALHTNAPGFDPSASTCAPVDPAQTGRGEISIALCNRHFMPVRSTMQRWPFDDDDSLAILPYRYTAAPISAFCGRRLIAADYNVVLERVETSDGSLSNYAVQHGYRYINFETEDRGGGRRDILQGRDRLVAMIDGMMTKCGEIIPVSLDPPRSRRGRR